MDHKDLEIERLKAQIVAKDEYIKEMQEKLQAKADDFSDINVVLEPVEVTHESM